MKRTILGVVLLMFATQIFAVPALTDWVRFRQPNTDIYIDILLKGDERVHWAESEDGHTLLTGDDGALYYAMPDGKGGMMPSQHLALPRDMRAKATNDFLLTIPTHLHFSQAQVEQMLSLWNRVEQQAGKQKSMDGVLGEKEFLVILFAFQDQAFTNNKAAFQALFNQVGYTANHATGSVHDYYYDCSYGQFSLHVDVVGPFTGVYETAHYGNSDNGYQDFASEAVDSAAKYVDFSKYDNDKDGYIDGLHIIFAGHGEEAGAGADKIWSHKWNIFSSPTYNNTVINVYSCSPECSGNQGTNLTAVGVICHELGHVFGSPDYYDTDYAGSGGDFPGLGEWDIMSSGSWNNSGRTPAHHNPYTKIYIYKWATCDTLTTSQIVHLNRIEDSKEDYHRVNTSTPGDFFLIENRQKEKWDRHIPGHGMLVYHIHPDAHGASVANYRHPQQIYILAHTADTFPSAQPYTYGSLNSTNAAYPGTIRRTRLDDNSCPWFRPWSKQPNNSPISFISENTSSGIVSFCFKDALPESSNLTATGVSDSIIRLDWTNYGNLTAMALISTDGVFGTPSGNLHLGDTLPGGGIVAALSTTNTAYLSHLAPNTHYYIQLYNKLTDTTYTAQPLNTDASTMACNSSEWTSEGFEDATTLPDCWVGDWSITGPRGHTGAHCLTAQGTDRTVTTSPILLNMPSGNGVLSFYSHFASFDTSSRLEVFYRATFDSEWDTLATLRPQTTSWEPTYAVLPALSDYALLQFHLRSATPATVSIDDIQLSDGYLVHAYCTTGGHVSNEGYSIHQRLDTVIFNIERDPGYSFANLYLNGDTYTSQVHNSQFQLVVRKHSELRFTFMRNNAAEEAPLPESNILAYPNPAGNTLYVECSSEEMQQALLFDIYGRQVRHAQGQGRLTLDLTGLPRGLYILRHGTHTQKIIKQ